jgi:hypothetical protein
MNLHQMKEKLQKEMLTMQTGRHSKLMMRANEEETMND